MSKIAAEDAFRVLAKWSRERAAIPVLMSRPPVTIGGQGAASEAILNDVLPHSQKALLTVRDEDGEDVAVTADLGGAEWETGAGWLAATFPNENRYVFGERDQEASE